MSNLSNKQFLTRILLSGKRIDGRDLLQNRDISVIFSQKLGGIELSYGETRVFTTTKASIVSPHVSRPSEGFLKFKVDLQVIGEEPQGGNALYEGINPTNPKKYSMELEKIIERIIKGSKALDPESLCIQSAKSVWSIQVDTVVINNQGNLIDAVFLSVMLSLLHFRRPQVEILPQEGIRVFKESEKRFMPLSIHHIPITFTFALIEEGENNSIAIDPTFEEEIVSGGRITVAINIYGDISYIHKPGGLPISQKLICQIIQVCIAKVPQYTTLLRDFLSKSNEITFNKIKSQIPQPQQLLFSLGGPNEQLNKPDINEVEAQLKARMDQE